MPPGALVGRVQNGVVEEGIGHARMAAVSGLYRPAADGATLDGGKSGVG